MVFLPTALLSSMPDLLHCQASGSLADTTLNSQKIQIPSADRLFPKT